ncbi:MAG: hypothetical protein SGJ19_25300 [Planctomycetia bacterium]|nr:hypothetical protein [Planctomycetia bacterium]
MFERIFHSVTAHWQNAKVPLLAATDPAEIDRVFVALNFPLSDDVRRLYATLGGFVDDHMDEKMFSLWSLGKIAEERSERGGEILYFADFLISSHVYGFRHVNAATSEVVIDHHRNSATYPPYVIAPDVATFFEQYLRDPWSVEIFV